MISILSELELNRASFDLWKASGAEDNQDELNRIKRLIPLILDECCTDIQKAYIKHYFVDQMSTTQIAKQCGISKSAVSRTIHRGMDKIYKYMRFSSPIFINAPQMHVYLKNDGRKRKNRT